MIVIGDEADSLSGYVLICAIPGAMDQRFRGGAVEDSVAPRSLRQGV
jgi:hypothetical protein